MSSSFHNILIFAMNDDIYYSCFEDLHQIKYLQSFTMKILLFILHSSSSYFMSLTTMFSLLIFNEHPFKQEKKLKKEQKTFLIKISIR